MSSGQHVAPGGFDRLRAREFAHYHLVCRSRSLARRTLCRAEEEEAGDAVIGAEAHETREFPAVGGPAGQPLAHIPHHVGGGEQREACGPGGQSLLPFGNRPFLREQLDEDDKDRCLPGEAFETLRHRFVRSRFLGAIGVGDQPAQSGACLVPKDEKTPGCELAMIGDAACSGENAVEILRVRPRFAEIPGLGRAAGEQCRESFSRSEIEHVFVHGCGPIGHFCNLRLMTGAVLLAFLRPPAIVKEDGLWQEAPRIRDKDRKGRKPMFGRRWLHEGKAKARAPRRRGRTPAAIALLLGVALLGAGLATRPLPAAADDHHPPANGPDVPFSAATGKRDPQARIRVPAGFRVSVFAEGLGHTRHLAMRDDGTLYASLSRPVDGAGIIALKDSDGDGRADLVRRFGEVAGTGIAIYGNWLYFGESTRLLRFPLEDGDMLPAGAPEVVVDGFPEQGQHATKPMTFDDTGHMYVTVGAPSNACQQRMRTAGSPGLMPCPQRRLQAGIWRYDADRTGQRHGHDGMRFATGIRNALALRWNRSVRALFFVTHGRDQLYSLWPQYYTPEQSAELPGEEFHRAVEGGDYGWPYTYWDPLRHARMTAPEYGGDGRTVAGDPKYRAPLYAFPAHWAPMDLVFYEKDAFPAFFRHGAFIVFHGSWNRAPLPQEGYLVAFMPMNAKGELSGRPIVFADGFKGREPLSSPRKAAFRPSGLAIGPDGALYVCEDRTGRIWKIVAQETPTP